MNYTGNPRRLRSHPRPSQRGIVRRSSLSTPIPSKRPQLDICQPFQERQQKSSQCGSVADSKSISDETDSIDTFETKRRRLLQKQDWLGLDLAAPIKVSVFTERGLILEIYDIRASKERRRRANGPFMRPLFREPSETLVSVSPAQLDSLTRSPAATSHSSTSLRPQPTVPSVRSSQHGSGFVTSQHSSPALAQRATTPSTSTLSTSNRSGFLSQQQPIPQFRFTPDRGEDLDFFSPAKTQRDPSDMKSVWALVEEQKQEDELLLKEFGWESQSGATASQGTSQLRSPSRDTISNVTAEVLNLPQHVSDQHLIPANPPRGTVEYLSKEIGGNGVDSSSNTKTERNLEHETGASLVTTLPEITEEDDEEDEGLPWF